MTTAIQFEYERYGAVYDSISQDSSNLAGHHRLLSTAKSTDVQTDQWICIRFVASKSTDVVIGRCPAFFDGTTPSCISEFCYINLALFGIELQNDDPSGNILEVSYNHKHNLGYTSKWNQQMGNQLNDEKAAGYQFI